MTLKDKIIKVYGDRGYKFDFLLVTGIIILLLMFNVSFVFVRNITNSINESSISFLGIVVGFLLTTFSLLFLYDPKNSEKLKAIRDMPVYKNMLSSFISTAFVIILLTIGILVFNALTIPYMELIGTIIFLFILFSILRVFKCIFYLYAIIELS